MGARSRGRWAVRGGRARVREGWRVGPGFGRGKGSGGLTDGGVLRELRSLVDEEEGVGELTEGWSRARKAMRMLQREKE